MMPGWRRAAAARAYRSKRADGLLVAWRRQARLLRRLAAAQRDRDVALASITDNVTLVDTDMRIVWANWSGGRSACSLNDPTPGEI